MTDINPTKTPFAAAILNQAEQYAHEILGAGQKQAASEPKLRTSDGSTHTVHHYYHHDPIWYYPSRPIVNVDCGSCAPRTSSSSSSSRKDDKKEDNTVATVLLFAAVAGIFLGICHAAGTKIRELKEGTGQIENLDAQMSLAITEGTGKSVQKVVDLQKKMLKIQHNHDVDGFWALGKMGACTVGAGLGIFTSPLIFGAAALTGLGFGAHRLIQKGEFKADPTLKEDAEQLLKTIADTRSAIKA